MRDRLLEIANLKYPQGVNLITSWADMIEQLIGIELSQQLKKINEFFNRSIFYTEDAAAWGQSDYWATPFELLTTSRGDCEDYAIAKYVSLRLLNVPDDALRIMYVYATTGNTKTAHMVMGVVLDETCYILDNMVSSIRTLEMRPDLTPVFGFNMSQLWVHDQLTTEDPTHRLSKWQNLIEKLSEDGLTL